MCRLWFTLRCGLLSLLLMSGWGCASPIDFERTPVAAIESSLVFHPSKYPEGDWTPSKLPVENAWFTAPDGTRLHGWYVRHPKAAGVALFAHGNAGNVTYWADTLRILHQRHHLTVLAFDYRGFGRSEGMPSEPGLLQDARAARAWLAKEEGIQEQDIILMGQSLGGGVVVDLAATDGARGLVLASTFTSLPDVAQAHVPAVPRHWLKNRFDSLAKIRNYHGPLLQVHGDQDRLVPFAQGQKLFAAANEPKRFVTVPGGDHNTPLPEAYRQALDDFLASLPPYPTSAAGRATVSESAADMAEEIQE